MNDSRQFSSSGFRWYNGNTPSLKRKNKNQSDYIVYGVRAYTDTVISSGSVFAPGYDGDANFFGQTIPAGRTHYGRYAKLVLTSGTGEALLE